MTTITDQDRQKAEKIVEGIEIRIGPPVTEYISEWMTDQVAAALAEAREESGVWQKGYDIGFKEAKIQNGRAYDSGYAKAVEDAAKVAETPRYCGCNDPRQCETCSWILNEREIVAKAIRGLKK